MSDEWRDEDVALRLVHTADWHLGKRFLAFSDQHRQRLSRARLDSLDRVFGIARSVRADAILCAGDLFDEPDPPAQWWEALLERLKKQAPERPIFLLPGNHDPLIAGSVYQESHPFRRGLPSFVHVVDSDEFTSDFAQNAVLYAVPCRSRSGQGDPTARIPAREPGDDRIRIGLVHGSTLEINGQCNFPIAADAPQRLGLDYLAIGDHHGFRAQGAMVYPGTHEPTSYGEKEPGMACLVEINYLRKALASPRRVAHWTWENLTCQSLSDLRALRDGKDRKNHVVSLNVDMRLPAPDYREAEQILQELEGNDAVIGRIGILQLNRDRLFLDTTDFESLVDGLPPLLRSAAERLKALESGPQQAEARQALLYLTNLAREGK